MLQVLQSGFLKALGWALIDSLWQMGCLWLVYTVLSRNGRKLTANQRHNLAFVSLAVGAAWFLATIIMHLVSGNPSVMFPETSPGYMSILSGSLEPMLPVFSCAYLLMTIILMVRLYRQYQYTRIISRQGLQKADPEIRVFLRQLAPGMGIKKEIRVYLSGLVETPLTIGFWKPVILLPLAIVNNLSMKQTEALILHELYHIQRNDFVMNLLLAFADILLFFNPFARSLKEVIQQEREHRCDDIVMQFRYEPAAYAEALLILEKQRPDRNTVALAATGTKKLLLLARVKRLLTGETTGTPISQRLLAVLASALVIAFFGIYQPGKAFVQKQILTLETGSQPYPADIATTAESPESFDVLVLPAADEEISAEEISGPAVEFQAEDHDPAIEASVARILVSEKIGEYLSVTIDQPAPAFIKSETPSEYSIQFNVDATPAAPEPVPAEFPYVPRNSFEFYPSENTVRELPETRFNTSQGSVQDSALEDFYKDSALTWTDVEREVEAATSELNIVTLEKELDKAVAGINWRKLNTDRKAALTEAQLNVLKSKLEIAKINREKQLKLSSEAAKQKAATRYQPVRVQKAGTILKIKKIVTI